MSEHCSVTDELAIGDRVTVVRGPLEGFDGVVVLIDETRRKSLIELRVCGRNRQVILSNRALAKVGE